MVIPRVTQAADALRRAAQAREVPMLAQNDFEGWIWVAVTSGGAKMRRVPDLLRTNAAALLGPAHGLKVPGYDARRVFTGLVRRDIAFVRRLAGRSCLVITDQSPYPPGARHSVQFHVGHFTLTWLEEEEGDGGDKELRVRAYTCGIWFSETTAAKVTMSHFERAIERLISVSTVLQCAG
eukprot:gene5270-6832_t